MFGFHGFSMCKHKQNSKMKKGGKKEKPWVWCTLFEEIDKMKFDRVKQSKYENL